MKCTFLLLSVLAINFAIAQNFTTGNLVVYRAGDGTAALTSAATAAFLNEYTPTGTLVRSVALPTVVAGANKRLTLAGTAASEGLLSRSSDKQFLIAAGYDAAVATAGVVATSAARVVGRISVDGSIDATTALTDFGGNHRSATSADGTAFWVTSSSGGTRYATLGSTTSTLLSTAPTNVRQVNIFNGQLYISSASSTFFGISSVGTGLPTTSGQTTSILPGFPTATGPSSYAFSIKPTSADIIYVADDRTTASGGIQKWTLAGGNWTLTYTLTPGLGVGVRGLSVNWAGAEPIIYATTTDNRLVTVTDAGSASPVTTLATASLNTAFRGVAFAPEAAVVPVKLNSFAVQKLGNSLRLSWATSQEANSLKFVIERSYNGLNWGTIGAVAATGNSNTIRNYSFVDNAPRKGINFYRLNAVDNDARFSNSEVKSVLFSKADVVLITPNPASSFVNIYMSKNNISLSQIIVTDLNGKLVERVSTADQTYQLRTSGYTKGTYVIKVIGSENTSTQKVIIQ